MLKRHLHHTCRNLGVSTNSLQKNPTCCVRKILCKTLESHSDTGSPAHLLLYDCTPNTPFLPSETTITDRKKNADRAGSPVQGRPWFRAMLSKMRKDRWLIYLGGDLITWWSGSESTLLGRGGGIFTGLHNVHFLLTASPILKTTTVIIRYLLQVVQSNPTQTQDNHIRGHSPYSYFTCEKTMG